MKNFMLNYVYKLLYKESFDYNDFEKRLKMQKGIYLLQELGFSLGDYKFTWYKYGPYSQKLLDDSYKYRGCEIPKERINIMGESIIAIEILSNILKKPSNCKYSKGEWAECLGTLRYIKENFLSYGASNREVLKVLKEEKAYLNDDKSNQIALERINRLFD